MDRTEPSDALLEQKLRALGLVRPDANANIADGFALPVAPTVCLVASFCGKDFG